MTVRNVERNIERNVEVRAGARLPPPDVTCHLAPGDRAALVRRDGAGNTPPRRTTAGELRPAGGATGATGPAGHLAPDPRGAGQDRTVTDRVLAARGLGSVTTGPPRPSWTGPTLNKGAPCPT
jgi:ATPase subunit of ABC transporter with duplicated ATPase domains